MSNYKQNIKNLPLLGNIIGTAALIFHLPKILEIQRNENRRLENLNEKLNEKLMKVTSSQNKQAGELNAKQLKIDDLSQKVAFFEKDIQTMGSEVTTNNRKSEKILFADDHVLDMFYSNFEDKFRGTEDLIKERLKEYLPIFSASSINFTEFPVLDIGCGRGEMLQLLNENGIKSIGLDINTDMVNRAKKKGLEAIEGDALEFLENGTSQTYGAITGFHIIEHIPFPILIRTLSAIYRSLKPGGFMIMETPNPENVLVSSHSFYLDPSHLHPLPPNLMAFALETCGFLDIEILRLHPDDEKYNKDSKSAINKYFWGPRDYAIIGYK